MRMRAFTLENRKVGGKTKRRALTKLLMCKNHLTRCRKGERGQWTRVTVSRNQKREMGAEKMIKTRRGQIVTTVEEKAGVTEVSLSQRQLVSKEISNSDDAGNGGKKQEQAGCKSPSWPDKKMRHPGESHRLPRLTCALWVVSMVLPFRMDQPLSEFRGKNRGKWVSPGTMTSGTLSRNKKASEGKQCKAERGCQ